MSNHGYANREELIRDHWERYGYRWNVTKWPRFNLPIRHKAYPYMPVERRDDEPPAHDTDYKLEFAFKRGEIDGRPAFRIVCEGVVVEEGPLPTPASAETSQSSPARHPAP